MCAIVLYISMDISIIYCISPHGRGVGRACESLTL